MVTSRFGDPRAAREPQPGHFGVHLMLDGYGGVPARLADPDVVHAWLEAMPRALGMRRLTWPFLIEVGRQSDKDPGGLTGFVLIAESHLSVHTFPQRGFVSADIYTCQVDLDPRPVTARLVEAFGLDDLESQMVRRGTRYPAADLDVGRARHPEVVTEAAGDRT